MMQDLIVKYLSGNISDIENEVLKSWIDSDKKNKEEFEFQLKLWSIIGEIDSTVPDIDMELSWNSFSNKLEAEKKKSRSFFVLKIASVFIVAVFCAKYIINFNLAGNSEFAQKNSHKTKENYKQTDRLLGKTEKTIVLKPFQTKVIVKNNNVIQDTIYQEAYNLSDSSTAVLTPSSVLTALDQTPHQNRIVSLSGAGLFDIKPSDKNFQLETEDLIIKVQGTKFNIQNSTVFSHIVEIIVEEGEMEVQDKSNLSNNVLIKAKQTYHFDRNTREFKLLNNSEETNKKGFFYKLFQKQ